ncbi:ATP-binding cassette sub-family A member 3 isoform X3 [Sarcophilus harrisii]|uniref:ATP-binding cassette sub-family A member 3 isoform X3 n=1 Tax=Sarcophilus harrisii TaxID=9305 RepID=UPI001301E546|nr:ATP-binding cassette sub-family A member 3 isoform X3 [Sarcophilus harrisii]
MYVFFHELTLFFFFFQKWQRYVVIAEFFLMVLFALLLLFFRYIVSKNAAKFYNYTLIPIDKLPTFFENVFEQNKWELIYVPSNSETVKTIVEDAYEALGIDMKVSGFTSEDIFEEYMKFSSNSTAVLAAIVFNHDFTDGKDTLPLQVSYSLRFSNNARNIWYFWKNMVVHDELAVWHTDLLFPVFPEAGPRNSDSDDGGEPGYFAEGFLTIQHAINKAIMRYHAKNTARDLFNITSVFIRRFPFPVSSADNFYPIFIFFLPLTIILVFSVIVFNMIRFVMLEKESMLKEYLCIMGMSNLMLWSSYFFTYFLFFLFIIIVLTLILLAKIVYLPIIIYSEGSLVFFFLMCSAIVSIFFSFMISTFFNKTTTAVALGGFLYFLTYLPYSFIHSYYKVMSLNKKLLSCLFSNVAILLGIQILISSEITENGISWTKLTQPVTRNENLTFGHILGMLIFDSFLYAVVTWYIQAVFPGNLGIPQPWNFFLMKSYWYGTSAATVDKNTETYITFENPYIEEEPVGLEVGIQIQNLSKVFITNNIKKYAVNDLTLNFYKGQITVLLGHNGAGKTTILSMLTGMLPPTSGEAYICGYEISKSIVQVRESMSFCPQYDILFHYMTVAEHLYLYGQLKGLTRKECRKEIKQTLKFFDLEEKHDDYPKSLTAGMKRKLSLCITLLGGSKVIILDEPTSRMDPITQNNTWELLQQYKQGHTIVLTTHNMEEADVLGAGYHMIIVKEFKCDTEKIFQVVQQYVPEANLENNFGTELSFSLPKESTYRFVALFNEIETRQKELGITTFGVSVTTMEEVFFRVDKMAASGVDLQNIQFSSLWMQQEEITKKSLLSKKKAIWRRQRSSTFMDINAENPFPFMYNTGWKLYCQQFYAMFNKKALHCWRNWKMTLIHILAPLLFSFLLLKSFNSLISQQNPPLKLDLSLYGKTIVPFSVSGNMSLINNISESLYIILKNMGQQPQLVTGEMEGFLLESKTCVEHCIIAISLEVTNSTLMATALFNNQAYHSAGIAVSVLDNILFRMLSGPDTSIIVSNKPQPVSMFTTEKDVILETSNGHEIAFSLSFGLAALASRFSLQAVKERVKKMKHMQFVTGVCIIIFWVSALIWDLFIFFIPCLLFLVVFKACQIETLYNNFMDALMIFMLYGWCTIPLMYLMGFFYYRASTAYTKLFMFNFFSGWASFLFVYLVEIKALYLAQYAEIVSDIFIVLPSYNLVMAVSGFYEFVRNKQLCDLLTTETDDCLLYGSYFYKISNKGIGKFLIAMAVLGFIFLLMLFLIEIYSWELKSCFNRLLLKIYHMWNWNLKINSDPVTFPEDEDVVKEREKVLECPKNMISSLNSLLVIRKLTKVYFKQVPFIAVDKLTLTVQKGECLGLLGFSGAGKTTTFKMLTGDETITSGDAFFENHSLCWNIREVRKIIGYCPQYNALLDYMTGREIAMMFARLRGIPEPYIQQYVEHILQALLIERHSDKLISTYSGGTKQKMNNAIAFLGFPPIIFLDEPSTGMDPVARHLLWDLITCIRESGKAIVLSSHSIEECEVLCTKLAIMAKGKLQCFGSPQYLKNKFSKGYTLVATIKKDSKDTDLEHFKESVKVIFPGSKLVQEHQRMVRYLIPSEILSWSKVFGILEEIKDDYNLEDYTISQTTLEQVFMSFANTKEEEEETIE